MNTYRIHRKLTPHLKAQLDNQSKRIKQCGIQAYNAFINIPTEVGALDLRWVDQIKIQMI